MGSLKGAKKGEISPFVYESERVRRSVDHLEAFTRERF